MILRQDVRQQVARYVQYLQRTAGLSAADVDRGVLVQGTDGALDRQVGADLLLADHERCRGPCPRFHLDLAINTPRQRFLERLTCSLGHVQLAAQCTGDAT